MITAATRVRNSIPDHQTQTGIDDAIETRREDWGGLYQQLAEIRERGGYRRDEAELLAWHELECRWHLAHCEPVGAGLCAGCQQPLGDEDFILLIDGNRCHDRNGHACLIQYGVRWRDAAASALIALGLRPPTGAP